MIIAKLNEPALYKYKKKCVSFDEFDMESFFLITREAIYSVCNIILLIFEIIFNFINVGVHGRIFRSQSSSELIRITT